MSPAATYLQIKMEPFHASPRSGNPVLDRQASSPIFMVLFVFQDTFFKKFPTFPSATLQTSMRNMKVVSSFLQVGDPSILLRQVSSTKMKIKMITGILRRFLVLSRDLLHHGN